MRSFSSLALAILFFAAFAPQGFAAKDENAGGGPQCFSRDERRAAIVAKQVTPLAAALRSAHIRRSELVQAELCRSPKGLVYLLTLIARDGKVTRLTVDAVTGKAEGR